MGTAEQKQAERPVENNSRNLRRRSRNIARPLPEVRPGAAIRRLEPISKVRDSWQSKAAEMPDARRALGAGARKSAIIVAEVLPCCRCDLPGLGGRHSLLDRNYRHNSINWYKGPAAW